MTWSDIFLPWRKGYQTADEAQANFDTQGKKLNEQIGNGDFSARQIQQIQAAEAAGKNLANDQNAAARGGFVEGLKDGLNNVTKAVTGAGPFKAIPIWVWLVALGVLFWWVGGVGKIKGILKKAA